MGSRGRFWLIAGVSAVLLPLVALVADSRSQPPLAAAPTMATPESHLLLTELGSTLRVGPPGVEHLVGFVANGTGAVGIAVAADGAFLAFTCAMRPQADAWFSGDWYRGKITGEQPVEVAGPNGEEMRIARTSDGRLVGTLVPAAGGAVPVTAAPAGARNGLYRREDADGVLGAVALSGVTVCAVKQTTDDRFLPAGTVPF